MSLARPAVWCDHARCLLWCLGPSQRIRRVPATATFEKVAACCSCSPGAPTHSGASSTHAEQGTLLNRNQSCRPLCVQDVSSSAQHSARPAIRSAFQTVTDSKLLTCSRPCLLFCRRVVAEQKPKIVFVTSPNNPDGSTITEEDLQQILALPVLVVLDEAYIEFCTDVPSRIKYVQQYNNLVVLRTFSKCAALAGMRVGYGAFPLGMIEYLWRAKQPYNVSVAAEVRDAVGCAGVASMLQFLHQG